MDRSCTWPPTSGSRCGEQSFPRSLKEPCRGDASREALAPGNRDLRRSCNAPACFLRALATGMRKVKRVPSPSVEVTDSVPRWALAISAAMNRPRPRPGPGSSDKVRENGWNRRSSLPGGMAAPSLCTDSSKLPSWQRASTRTGRSASPCSSALASRLSSNWARRLQSQTTAVSSANCAVIVRPGWATRLSATTSCNSAARSSCACKATGMPPPSRPRAKSSTSWIISDMCSTLPWIRRTLRCAAAGNGSSNSISAAMLIACSGLRRSCPSTAMNCSRSLARSCDALSSWSLRASRSSESSCAAISCANSSRVCSTCGSSSFAGSGSSAHKVPKKRPSWRTIGAEIWLSKPCRPGAGWLANTGGRLAWPNDNGLPFWRISLQSVVSSASSAPGCRPKPMLSCTAQAVQRDSVTRATAAKRMPVAWATAFRMVGTASMRLIAAMSCAIDSSLTACTFRLPGHPPPRQNTSIRRTRSAPRCLAKLAGQGRWIPFPTHGLRTGRPPPPRKT